MRKCPPRHNVFDFPLLVQLTLALQNSFPCVLVDEKPWMTRVPVHHRPQTGHRMGGHRSPLGGSNGRCLLGRAGESVLEGLVLGTVVRPTRKDQWCGPAYEQICTLAWKKTLEHV